MNHPMPEDEDKRLELLFRAASVPVADDGFTAKVMQRIARRAWQRRLVLTGAGALGLAVAWQPLWGVADMLGQSLVVAGGRWTELLPLLYSPYALGAGLLVLIAPGALRALDD